MLRLEKNYEVKSSSQAFFRALTDQSMVSQWSGAPAIMGARAGDEFSLWGGSIIGVNKSVSDQRLEQLWKEKSWNDFSLVVFEWHADSYSLHIKLIHEDIPEDSYQNIQRGWDEHYMNPLISWLESNNF